MGNELLGRAGEHPHFKQERLNNERERLSNERFRPSVNERTGEHIHPERKSSWNLFDSLRGSARKETEDLKRTTGDISHATERRAEDTMRATGDTVRSAENRAGDALRTAENKMGETWRATEGKGEEALRTAEEKSRSFFDSFRNRAGESYDYVKDKAGNTEQTVGIVENHCGANANTRSSMTLSTSPRICLSMSSKILKGRSTASGAGIPILVQHIPLEILTAPIQISSTTLLMEVLTDGLVVIQGTLPSR